MKFEHTKVMNMEAAFRGMRNPKNSWDLSDSFFSDGSDDCVNTSFEGKCRDCQYFDGYGRPCLPLLGPKDLKLAQTLIRSGSEHRKFMRQIFVSVDITAPLYWWKEADTYKVGTVANSTSTMHKLASTPISLECFETGDYNSQLTVGESEGDFEPLSIYVEGFVEILEILRKQYLKTKNKQYWKELIRWLPEAWLQKRTVTLSYENLLAMCSKGQRRFHKLTEWSEDFIQWARSLPYAQELIFLDELDDQARLESETLREEEAAEELSNKLSGFAISHDSFSLKDMANMLAAEGWRKGGDAA